MNEGSSSSSSLSYEIIKEKEGEKRSRIFNRINKRFRFKNKHFVRSSYNMVRCGVCNFCRAVVTLFSYFIF